MADKSIGAFDNPMMVAQSDDDDVDIDNDDLFDIREDEDDNIFRNTSLDIQISPEDPYPYNSVDVDSHGFDIVTENNKDGDEVKEQALKNKKSKKKREDRYKVKYESKKSVKFVNDETQYTQENKSETKSGKNMDIGRTTAGKTAGIVENVAEEEAHIVVVDDGDNELVEEQGEEVKLSLKEICKYNDVYYRKYWDGRLKIGEVILSALCALSLSYNYDFYHTRFIYSRVVSISSFVFASIELLLNLFSIWYHLPSCVISSELHIAFSGIMGVCFIVASSLIIPIADVTGNESFNWISALFGIACSILYALETVLHVLRHSQANPLTGNPIQ